jgi:SAM-dependent methyltransferase
MGYAVVRTGANPRLIVIVPLLSGGLFLACLFCHGELVRLKPRPRFLTRFYLMISAGGAAGGIFVSLLAPRVFSGYVEFPITLTVCALLALYLTFALSWRAQALWVAVTMYLALCILGSVQRHPGELLRTRNFYGLLEVRDVTGGPQPYRVLHDGGIVHGIQMAGEGRSRRPTTYYGTASGIGAAIASRRPGPLRIGLVGLGAGTLAAYGQRGDYFRFYEINPQVLEVAGSLFRFLRESPAQVDVLIGDGRLLLERDPPQAFDILAVDAFSGDAIPVHLLTREALAVYARHLKPDGLLALHITNTYLDLRHVTGRLAQAAGWDAVLIEDQGDKSQLTLRSLWVLAGCSAALKPLQHGQRLVSAPGDLWTDDYSNLYRTLR